MSQPKVQFLFDFGSPNAFLAHQVLPEISARTGVPFEYVPALLGGIYKATGNQAPSQAFKDIPSKLAYESLEVERFIRRHGIIGFTDNPFFPVNTLMIMRGAVAARRQGVFEAYVDKIFDYMWREPRKLDDLDVLTQTLADAGLPVEALLTGAQDADVKQELIRNTEAAVEHGAFGSPSFLVDGQLWFGKDKLRDVEEAIVATS